MSTEISTPKTLKISQSLIKNYVDYLNGKECGLYFKANYIDKDPEAQREPSDAMRTGIYFEYLCTGSLPKSGQIPEPDYVYKGKPNQKLSAPYERVMESVENYKRIIQHYGIEIVDVGVTYKAEVNGVPINGVVDIVAKWDGELVFIDLKYSGLINDKWSESGWETESLHLKDSLMIQGVHYKLLANKSLGVTDIPFYYFVFSSQDPNDIKIIKQEVDESKMQSHIVAIGNISEKLDRDIKYGFNALPSLKKCTECPISHKCSSKIDYPLVEEVFY
jgi:hypothetical protein